MKSITLKFNFEYNLAYNMHDIKLFGFPYGPPPLNFFYISDSY